MSKLDLRSIGEILRYVAHEGARVEQILQDINQFGVALARAEACTFWIRDEDYITVRENTAYPVCRTRRVPGARLQIVEADRPGLTAYMAYQFMHRPSEHKCFNFSAEAIKSHPAYRQADKEPTFNPYFPFSTTSLSILCAPVRINSEFVGMIKAENRFADDGRPSGQEFTETECSEFVEYGNILGTTVLSGIRDAILSDIGTQR